MTDLILPIIAIYLIVPEQWDKVTGVTKIGLVFAL